MSDTSAGRILVVDDDPSSLALLHKHLKDAGHDPLTAANGKEALHILAAQGPHMIITDWLMPEMNGLELCRAIRSHEGILFAYIIVLTASNEEERILEAFDAGADDYLSKPLKPRELLARVRAGERIIRLQQDLERHTREAHRFNAEMAIANDKLEDANNKLNLLATTDELTGLLNRREAMSRLQSAWAASVRYGQELACIAIDIDHFKRCNDTYGHAMGDRVLKHVAAVLRREARREESIFRIGGEEFLILCPNTTESMAEIAAERLRRAVAVSPAALGEVTVRVTLSAGVAERTTGFESGEELIRAADTALYAAKAAGRNTVRRAAASHPLSQCPTESQAAEIPSDAEIRPIPVPEKAAKVLLVHGDERERSFYKSLLQREGHQVCEVPTVLGAFHAAEDAEPDVIVLDGAVPAAESLRLVRALKDHPQTTGVPIVVTAVPAENMATWLGVGADEFVREPLDPSEFLLRINTMARFRSELLRSNAVRGEQSWALDLLLAFSRDIAAAESLDMILEATVTAVATMTCSRRVCILLPDADQTELRVARNLGLSESTAQQIRVPVGQATVGALFLDRRTVFFNTPEEARERQGDPDYELFPGSPGVCVALCAPECTVGVLTISGRQEARPFTESDLEYIYLICNIAAAALHECVSRKARDEARDSIVVALAKLAESRDSDTGRHLERVTQFCVLLATQLRASPRFSNLITDEFLADLKRAVPLHDIGKVAVPDLILLKPASLSPEEMVVMRTHAEIGAATIRSVIDRAPGARFLAMAEQIARSHHEWHNGRGYPQGLSGDEIPLPARIAAVADVYDALTTRRAYKPAIGHDEAVRIIVQASGTQFAPDVIEAFQRCTEEFRRLSRELADAPPLEPRKPVRVSTRSKRLRTAATPA